MTLYACAGLLGGGKSLAMVDTALTLVQKNRRDGLVTNQPLDIDAIERLAIKRKWWHLLKVCREGRIHFDAHTDLQTIISYKNAVVLLDEVGVFANARDWRELKQKAPHFFLHLLQSRKIGSDMVWAAQTHDMADPFLRSITNFFIHCEYYKAVDFYNRHWFAGERDYEAWLRTRRNFKYRIKLEWGFLDYDIAECYSTNIRLEDMGFQGNEIPRTNRVIDNYVGYEEAYFLDGKPLREYVQILMPDWERKERTKLEFWELVVEALPFKLPKFPVRRRRVPFQAALAHGPRKAPKVISFMPQDAKIRSLTDFLPPLQV